MLANARYVLDTGMRSDLLALQVALAPCVIGNAEIASRLAARPEALAETNPYRAWIAEYAGVPYQQVAEKARTYLERLADSYATPTREAELVAIPAGSELDFGLRILEPPDPGAGEDPAVPARLEPRPRPREAHDRRAQICEVRPLRSRFLWVKVSAVGPAARTVREIKTT